MEKIYKAKLHNVYEDEGIEALTSKIECELHIPESEFGIYEECYAICEVKSLEHLLDIINRIGIDVIISKNKPDEADIDIEIYDTYRE